MESFLDAAEQEDSALAPLIKFLKKEKSNTQAANYNDLRFVGYVLDISFDEVRLITSDPYKIAVGGIPRGSFLIMTPDEFKDGIPPHFTLLRVSGTTATPLSKDVEQTYFELHKKSMPELDIWTQSELQWGALKTDLIGMIYSSPKDPLRVEFSGDVNTIVSPHKYKVYAPDEKLLDLIINKLVPQEGQYSIGDLRRTECRLPFARVEQPNVAVNVSTEDFKGTRTAMFGKTRLGKSNVVKLVVDSLIDNENVGQIIFDINGEYANSSNQNMGFKEAYSNTVDVFAINQREATESKPLKLNFYERPSECISILGTFLEEDNETSHYVKAFCSISLPTLDDVVNMTGRGDKIRAARKIQMYWAILKEAGFDIDESIKSKLSTKGTVQGFNPGFDKKNKGIVLGDEESAAPASIDEMVSVYKKFAEKVNEKAELKSSSGKDLFDADDKSLLQFLAPKSGTGPKILQKYRIFHSKNATNFVKEIIDALDIGRNVILDLGSANEKIVKYFSDMLCKSIFKEQERKFTNNELDKKFIQCYFEEAHNLFPASSNDFTGIYTRYAKEGAKFHIGMVYSTQSPSTINQELLVQTENFYVAHLSSESEVNSLARLQVAFKGVERDILKAKTPGFLRLLSMSNRFVVPFQAKLFNPKKK